MQVIYYVSVIIFWNLNYQLTSSTFLQKINDLFVVEAKSVIQLGS